MSPRLDFPGPHSPLLQILPPLSRWVLFPPADTFSTSPFRPPPTNAHSPFLFPLVLCTLPPNSVTFPPWCDPNPLPCHEKFFPPCSVENIPPTALRTPPAAKHLTYLPFPPLYFLLWSWFAENMTWESSFFFFLQSLLFLKFPGCAHIFSIPPP